MIMIKIEEKNVVSKIVINVYLLNNKYLLYKK